MPFVRGDAHKLYLELQKNQHINSNRKLKEASEIKAFYESLDYNTLQLVYYRMIKEQNGSGMIPIYVTAIPWLLFLFSGKVQDFLFQKGSIIWVIFVTIYLSLLTISTLSHFREKAWAALHIEIITDVLHDKK
ncbi:hypothetical protein CIL05_21180 [Virgibacillus profundi]|uniref:Uncharacterized protein n=1 Tax=Virgibacillus profundi TaxID=2024555 RepID=A0A2A2I956_9BACI|nr:hypothetical protein [Virgibacillus profundi]PAV27593.1 hypothetical protein CIL05_21180 [Virgibacillus profundi]PXY54920.1 hypothetical protein CIT14_03205 [Virgibacillus profundi]